MKRLTRRSILAGIAAASASKSAGAFPFGRGGAPAAGGGGGGSSLPYNLVEVNDTGGTQTAGSRWLMRGLIFKDGDLAAGHYPSIKAGGVDQPFTPYLISHYPVSGAVMRMSVIIRPTYNLSAAATQALVIADGGTSAPSASGRTTTDLYNQSLSIQAVSAPPAGANITGTWGAWLRNDSNNYAQYSLGDGPAGRVWKIHTKMAQSAGGAAHDLLECYYYVAALNDASGNLGAVAFLGRITQPYWNKPAVTMDWRAFSSISWQYGAGPTVNSLENYAAAAFTNTATYAGSAFGSYFTDADNEFFDYAGIGISEASVGSPKACYLTTSGTLPNGLDTTHIWFVIATDYPTTSDKRRVYFSRYSQCGDQTSASSSNTGSTGTIHPVFICVPFSSIMTATPDANWQIFQGTGSVSSPVISGRTTYDRTYWQSTGLLGAMPYSLDATLIANVAAEDWTQDWKHGSIGQFGISSESPGERRELAPLNGFGVQHFYTQSARGEKNLRINGLAAAHMSLNFRDYGTGTFANYSNASWTGLPAASGAQQTLRNMLEPYQGFSFGDPYCLSHPWAESSYTHKPEHSYYSLLVTGRPEYLDFVMEAANGGISHAPAAFRNPTAPYNEYGCLVFHTAGRDMYWSLRDMALAAAVTPDTYSGLNYDGTDFRGYMMDTITRMCTWWVDVTLSTTYATSYGVTAGIFARVWTAAPDTPNGIMYGSLEWTLVYLVIGCCFASKILGISKATEFLQKGPAKFYAYVYANMHPYLNYQHLGHECRRNAYYSNGQAYDIINADNQFTISLNDPETNTSNPELPYFKWNDTGPKYWRIEYGVNTGTGGSGWLPPPADGDIVMWDLFAVNKPSNMPGDVPYYIRDAVPIAPGAFIVDCNLALTAGGTAIVPNSVQPDWQANHTYDTGSTILPTVGNAGGYYFRSHLAEPAKVSAGSHPTWPQTVNATVSDGTVTWTNMDIPGRYQTKPATTETFCVSPEYSLWFAPYGSATTTMVAVQSGGPDGTCPEVAAAVSSLIACGIYSSLGSNSLPPVLADAKTRYIANGVTFYDAVNPQYNHQQWATQDHFG